MGLLCFCSVLCLLCLCARLFVCALWSPAGGGGLASWLCLGCLLWVCRFPVGVLGRVWYLIVSIPDLCTFPYFVIPTSPLFQMWSKNICLVCMKDPLFIHVSSPIKYKWIYKLNDPSLTKELSSFV